MPIGDLENEGDLAAFVRQQLDPEGIRNLIRELQGRSVATDAAVADINVWLLRGTGDPNGAVVGSVGQLFLRSDGGAGTTFWVKESGAGTNTGWVGK